MLHDEFLGIISIRWQQQDEVNFNKFNTLLIVYIKMYNIDRFFFNFTLALASHYEGHKQYKMFDMPEKNHYLGKKSVQRNWGTRAKV